MRIISFCADSIKDAATKGFYEWATQQDADIICVQNLNAHEGDLVDNIFFPQGYNAYFLDAVNDKSNGVAIYCRAMPKAIMSGLGFERFDMEGRYIQADFDNLSVGCLLLPFASSDDADSQTYKQEFLDFYTGYLDKIRNKRREFILCGNWNIAATIKDLQNPDHLEKTPGALAEEQQWMNDVFQLGYVDAFREISSDADEFSWWPDGNRDENGWRVDYQIVSSGIKPLIEYGAIYHNKVFASHAPLIMDYDFELPAPM